MIPRLAMVCLLALVASAQSRGVAARKPLSDDILVRVQPLSTRSSAWITLMPNGSPSS